MIKRTILPTLVALLLIIPAAYADTIVDTGPGAGSGSGGHSWELIDFQYLAAQFSISQAYTVTDISGWIQTTTSDLLTIALYGDNGGDVPDVTNPLYQDSLTPAFGTSASWVGLTGLNWYLDPGEYWVAFEVPSTSTYFGAMPSPSTTPLANEAFTNYDSGYKPYDDLNIGVRIYGVIPEPTSLLLLGTGLGALGLVAYRRKRS